MDKDFLGMDSDNEKIEKLTETNRILEDNVEALTLQANDSGVEINRLTGMVGSLEEKVVLYESQIKEYKDKEANGAQPTTDDTQIREEITKLKLEIANHEEHLKERDAINKEWDLQYNYLQSQNQKLEETLATGGDYTPEVETIMKERQELQKKYTAKVLEKQQSDIKIANLNATLRTLETTVDSLNIKIGGLTETSQNVYAQVDFKLKHDQEKVKREQAQNGLKQAHDTYRIQSMIVNQGYKNLVSPLNTVIEVLSKILGYDNIDVRFPSVEALTEPANDLFVEGGGPTKENREAAAKQIKADVKKAYNVLQGLCEQVTTKLTETDKQLTFTSTSLDICTEAFNILAEASNTSIGLYNQHFPPDPETNKPTPIQYVKGTQRLSDILKEEVQKGGLNQDSINSAKVRINADIKKSTDAINMAYSSMIVSSKARKDVMGMLRVMYLMFEGDLLDNVENFDDEEANKYASKVSQELERLKNADNELNQFKETYMNIAKEIDEFYNLIYRFNEVEPQIWETHAKKITKEVYGIKSEKFEDIGPETTKQRLDQLNPASELYEEQKAKILQEEVTVVAEATSRVYKAVLEDVIGKYGKSRTENCSLYNQVADLERQINGISWEPDTLTEQDPENPEKERRIAILPQLESTEAALASTKRWNTGYKVGLTLATTSIIALAITAYYFFDGMQNAQDDLFIQKLNEAKDFILDYMKDR